MATGRALLAAITVLGFLPVPYAALLQETRPEIHCKHFFYGYPHGTPASNDLIIREAYALSSNDTTKFADWVAYRIDPTMIANISDPKRTWRADPWLDPSETLEPGDYTGANDALGTQRGHQAPLASFKSTLYARSTNYLSNITPQHSVIQALRKPIGCPCVAMLTLSHHAILISIYDLSDRIVNCQLNTGGF